MRVSQAAPLRRDAAANVPENQPANRFRGHPPALVRAPGPLPSWLASAPRKLGPIITPDPHVPWRSRSAFNPTTLVKDGEVWMLLRAEDQTGAGAWHGTSRIGLAVSQDGVTFRIRGEPVLGPTEPYEANGGCEDPRVVEIDGKYYLTYTAYEFPARVARLCLATSTDLVHWEKKGPMLPGWRRPAGGEWSKSGAIVPQQVNGEYLMYFGDESIYLARSPDLIHWKADPEPVLRPRATYWDSLLVEPGPTPFLDERGDVHLIYNGDAPPNGYAAGEVVFSGRDGRQVLSRSRTPLLEVTEDWERVGQVGSVIFCEGLARLNGRAYFYYGAADDRIAVAVADLSHRAC